MEHQQKALRCVAQAVKPRAALLQARTLVIEIGKDLLGTEAVIAKWTALVVKEIKYKCQCFRLFSKQHLHPTKKYAINIVFEKPSHP